MNTHCSFCNEIYEKETGFYWGAMYVSYALAVALSVVIGVVVYAFIGWHPFYMFISIILGITLCSPIVFRLSRTIWLYMFIDYDEHINLK